MPPTVATVPEDAVAEDAVPATITRRSVDEGSKAPRDRADSVVDVYAPAEKYYGDSNQSHKPKRSLKLTMTRSSSRVLYKGAAMHSPGGF